MQVRALINMKIENQVVSLALAKKLKKLGVKKNSLVRWQVWNDPYTGILRRQIIFAGSYTYGSAYAAFTVAELGEMLPKLGAYGWIETKRWKDGKWHCSKAISSTNEAHRERANTEADARAKMLIYLIENKLIDHS